MKKWPQNGVLPTKFPILLPLYQPLWYRGDLFFFAKKCIFWYIGMRKFFTWRKFRSKPRCKKIVTGGGVVQVVKKRAPQGLFLRNFTPPHETRSLDRANFCSSEEHFFEICEIFFHHAMMKFFSKFFRQKMTQKIVKKGLHRAYKSIITF